MFGETRGGIQWRSLAFVWLFQVLNIGLFRLDQSLVATIGARGGGTKLTADLLFWAKANDLANAVATALGGAANREEMSGRASRTILLFRWGFPAGCLLIYAAAWVSLSRHLDPQFLFMGGCSLGSAALAYEVNRLSFALMWRKEYAALLRAWAIALAVGGTISAFGVAVGQTWLLPLAVTVQLLLAIAVYKTISKTPA